MVSKQPMLQTRKWIVVCVSMAVVATASSSCNRRRRAVVAGPARLEVEVSANPAQIGIPGITKMYEGHLKNVGEASVKVRVCDAVSDAMQREIHVVHTIERWDSESQGWKELWRIPRQEFCRPYPTGIIEGRIVEVSLAPGQTVSTGEIAIQASDNLRLGDRLRFVVFPYSDGETVRLASPGFPVDERPSGRSRTDGGRQIEKRLTGPFR